MTSTLAKLNLRPQERRLIVFVVIVLFVVLNIWLVWPHFGDWALATSRYERALKTLDTYQAEIAKAKAYQVRLRELSLAGGSVVPDEQELDLVRTVDTQSRANKLNVIQSDPRPRMSANTQTNQFFEEQYVSLHVTSGNEELVNFLISLTSSNSLIRVKDLSIKPDPSSTKLDGQMTLVASYQRTTPAPVRSEPAVRPTNLAATAAPKPPVSRALTKTNKPGTAMVSSNASKVPLPKARQTNQPARKLDRN